MTLSIEQSILEKVKDRINSDPIGPLSRPDSLLDIEAERSRLREIPANKNVAIGVYPLEASSSKSGCMVEVQLSIKIVVWAKGEAGIPIDETTDPIYLWIHQQLTADETLGGLSIRILPNNPAKVWGFHLAQAPFGDLDLHYQVTYRHPFMNPIA